MTITETYEDLYNRWHHRNLSEMWVGQPTSAEFALGVVNERFFNNKLSIKQIHHKTIKLRFTRIDIVINDREFKLYDGLSYLESLYELRQVKNKIERINEII